MSSALTRTRFMQHGLGGLQLGRAIANLIRPSAKMPTISFGGVRPRLDWEPTGAGRRGRPSTAD